MDEQNQMVKSEVSDSQIISRVLLFSESKKGEKGWTAVCGQNVKGGIKS